MHPPLTRGQLEETLDALLYAVTPAHSVELLAPPLAALDREEQDFVLHWTEIIAPLNAELAYEFAVQAPLALHHLALADATQWIIEAMDIYDRLGLYPARAALRDVHPYVVQAQQKAVAVSFDRIKAMLEAFVHGLSGRALKLAAGDEVYTDGETLYLPRRIAQFSDRDRNFRLYKAMGAHLCAQLQFGTLHPHLLAWRRGFDRPDEALALFHALETARLDARLADELPGLFREMRDLRRAAGNDDLPADFRPHLARLSAPVATADDSLEVASALYGTPVPPPACYQGSLFPERVAQARDRRGARAQARLRAARARAAAAMAGDETDADEGGPRSGKTGASEHSSASNERAGDAGGPSSTGEPRGARGATGQTGDEAYADHLEAGDADLLADEVAREDIDTPQSVFVYDEWDYRRRAYRKDWCVLREIDVRPVEAPFVDDTLVKYAGLARRLRAMFEALRAENRLQKRCQHGDDLDLDAVVQARADLHAGQELSARLFTRTHRQERNIAVVFMVDMSGSTKGWINEAERESLVLLCDALEVLGDAYAIYGFSGVTRSRCELFRVKRFNEAYSDQVQARIGGIAPQDYTRMGVTIRHLSRLLAQTDARTKLLITLSDGKPDDYDGYRGDYGIEDTRQALFEARRLGIHPFCITIDQQARDYLPHMYGAANYTLIDDVRKLPARVGEVYRRLTG
jgi:nitric oxide reductase NorD protein